MNTTAYHVLGLRSRAPVLPMSLLDQMEKGFPLAALDRLAEAVAPGDAAFPFRLVPRPTLARRRKSATARLSPEESARLARLAEVWSLALEVWGGPEEARAFLFRPHPLLEERRPIDVVLASEFGRPLVEDILGGLRYGTAV